MHTMKIRRWSKNKPNEDSLANRNMHIPERGEPELDMKITTNIALITATKHNKWDLNLERKGYLRVLLIE